MSNTQLNALPLLFSFSELVEGNGFVSRVEMCGRALLEIERDGDVEEIWLTGIQPVGIAGGGGDRGVAFTEFRKAWLQVIFDIAAEAKSFGEFRKSCTLFLNSQQDGITGLWKAAVLTVRAQAYTDPSLRRGDADTEQVTFKVTEITKAQPNANQVDKPLRVAA